MSGSTQKKEAVGQGQVTLAPDAHLLQPLLEHARKTPDKPLFSRRVGDKFEPLTAGEIDSHVEHLATDHAHQFSLGLHDLIVEPAEYTSCGSRMVVLDELGARTRRLREHLCVEAFKKESAGVAENLRLKDHDIRNGGWKDVHRMGYQGGWRSTTKWGGLQAACVRPV